MKITKLALTVLATSVLALSFTSYAVSKNELTAAVFKDKIDHALGKQTNGLYKVSYSKSLAAEKDTESTVSFLRCSTSIGVFKFHGRCDSKRIDGKMTKESLDLIGTAYIAKS